MVHLLAIFLSILIVAPAPVAPPVQDLRDTVKAFVDAHNTHNVDAILALLADNIRYEEEGVDMREGKAEFREKEMWDHAVNAEIEVRRLQVRGNTVTGSAVEFSDYYRAAGIDAYNYDSITIEFEGGKITSIVLVPSSDSSNQFANALNSFVVWATNPNNGIDINRLKENGAWAFSSNTAPAWVELLNKWKEGNN